MNQKTPNKNTVNRLFEGYVSQNRLNLYGTRRISLPTLKYVVLYSGKQEEPDYKEYHFYLSTGLR